MHTSDPLLGAVSLLRPRLSRILAAVALGVLSLGSALALAGVSAWLITRAWQMPPVLDLSVAVVSVRMFAISRGVLRYCERLATHDTALRAAGTARAQVYHRLARGPAAAAVRLNSGELVARVGADVDAAGRRAGACRGPDRRRGGAGGGGDGGDRRDLAAGRRRAGRLPARRRRCGARVGRQGRRDAGNACPPTSFGARHVGDDRAGTRTRASRCRRAARR